MAAGQIFNGYHGWRMRGRLRIWQCAGGKAGRKKGGAPGGGGPGGQEKNY